MSACSCDLFPSLQTLFMWVVFYLAFRGLLDLVRVSVSLSRVWSWLTLLRSSTRTHVHHDSSTSSWDWLVPILSSVITEFLMRRTRDQPSVPMAPPSRAEPDIDFSKFFKNFNTDLPKPTPAGPDTAPKPDVTPHRQTEEKSDAPALASTDAPTAETLVTEASQ